MAKNIKNQLTLFRKFYLHPRAANGPIKETDLTMHSEAVDIQKFYQSLQESVFTTKILSEVSYKDEKYPILQLNWGQGSDKKLLIIAGVHGNEFAATLSIIALLDDVKASPDKYSGWHISIIAPANPVGFVCQSRYNEDGYDINRDFKDFQTVGARVQRDVIEGFNPNAIVSLHEGPQKGFFMISEGRLQEQIKESILRKLTENNISIAQKSFFGIRLRSGIWQKSAAIFMFQRLLNIHTLGSYARTKRITMVTTETTWSDTDISARTRPHILVIQGVVAT